VAEKFRIILELPPKVLSPNWTVGTTGGRFKKASAFKRYKRRAAEAVESCGIESFPWKYVHVEAEFFHKVKRKRDEDNAMGSLKAAYDGLVVAGVTADDDSQHMKREIPKFNKDTEDPRVELTITRIR
jgi:Holliday junction resolvase RusA-like endonuclease